MFAKRPASIRRGRCYHQPSACPFITSSDEVIKPVVTGRKN